METENADAEMVLFVWHWASCAWLYTHPIDERCESRALVYLLPHHIHDMLSLCTIAYYAYHGELQMAPPSTCIAFIFIGVSRPTNPRSLLIIWINHRVIVNVLILTPALSDGTCIYVEKAIEIATLDWFWRSIHLSRQPRENRLQ